MKLMHASFPKSIFSLMALLSLIPLTQTMKCEEPSASPAPAASVPAAAQKVSDFPVGQPLPEQYSAYFIGQAYLAPLTKNAQLGVSISNVTFEPSCRNNWHSHTGGQILIVLGGEGWYQEKGQAAQRIKAGDIVEIPPNVVHWHGATATSWLSHLAMEGKAVAQNENTWLEPVDDAHYNALETAPTP